MPGISGSHTFTMLLAFFDVTIRCTAGFEILAARVDPAVLHDKVGNESASCTVVSASRRRSGSSPERSPVRAVPVSRSRVENQLIELPGAAVARLVEA